MQVDGVVFWVCRLCESESGAVRDGRAREGMMADGYRRGGGYMDDVQAACTPA